MNPLATAANHGAPPPSRKLCGARILRVERSDVCVREFRDALLAELELRLQPVAGMIDALRIEAKQHQ